MAQEEIVLLTMIVTVLSAIGTLIAAYAAMKAAKSWKEQIRFESRRDAVSAWVGGAAAFRGRLKFIYKQQVKWPDDRKEIEYISEHFWSLVSLWPSVKANLTGDLKKEAEVLWQNVFNTYSSLMDGSGSLEELGAAVQTIYNCDILKKTIEGKSQLGAQVFRFAHWDRVPRPLRLIVSFHSLVAQAYMRRTIFWFASLPLAAFMALKSSDEPAISFIENTAAEPLFNQYSSGNNIIFDASIGFLVSAMFYFIVVYLPEKNRRENIKKNIGKVVSFILESFSGNPFHWSKHVIHCKPLSEYASSLNELKDIAKNRKLNALEIKVIVESAHEVLPTYEQLTPGALQLSPEHAILWLSLTNSIRQISTLYPCGEEESQNKDLGILDLNLLEFIEYTQQWENLKS